AYNFCYSERKLSPAYQLDFSILIRLNNRGIITPKFLHVKSYCGSKCIAKGIFTPASKILLYTSGTCKMCCGKNTRFSDFYSVDHFSLKPLNIAYEDPFISGSICIKSGFLKF